MNVRFGNADILFQNKQSADSGEKNQKNTSILEKIVGKKCQSILN